MLNGVTFTSSKTSFWGKARSNRGLSFQMVLHCFGLGRYASINFGIGRAKVEEVFFVPLDDMDEAEKNRLWDT